MFIVWHSKLDLTDKDGGWQEVRQVAATTYKSVASFAAKSYFERFVWTDPGMHISGSEERVFAEVADKVVHQIYVEEA